MSKYQNYWDEKKPVKKKGPHPIWMGIGFLLLIIIPGISWQLCPTIINEGTTHGWFQLTTSMFAPPPADPLLYVDLTITLLLSMGCFVVLYLIYFIVYRFVGPSRYGPMDAPVGAYKVKRYKR